MNPYPAPGAAPSAAPSPGDRPATFADFANSTFEAYPEVVSNFGTRERWMAEAAEHWPTLLFAFKTLGQDHTELSAAFAQLPDEFTHLIECVTGTRERFETLAKWLNHAELRLMGAGARAAMAAGLIDDAP